MNQLSKPLSDFGVDWSDFYNRWSRARISSLKKVMQYELDMPIEEQTEEGLLTAIATFLTDCTENQQEKITSLILRHVFDYSREVALGASRAFGLHLELPDFKDVLLESKIECVQGEWQLREMAVVLSRAGCDFCTQLGHFICDYWREAIDGFIMGFGCDERFVRHSTVRRGESKCQDVIFLDQGKRDLEGLSKMMIPDSLQAKLKNICLEIEEQYGITVEITGVLDGQLFYKIQNATDALCHASSHFLAPFKERIASLFPNLVVKDVTPRAVLGVEA